jgi:cytochrome bd-type quinol oxidase subunit 1
VLSFELGLLWPAFMGLAGPIIGMPFSLGRVVEVDPIAAMFNPAAPAQMVHMLLAAYASVGVAVAGIHAGLLLRDKSHPFHRRALAIALSVRLPAVLLLPLSGDWSAKVVAHAASQACGT